MSFMCDTEEIADCQCAAAVVVQRADPDAVAVIGIHPLGQDIPNRRGGVGRGAAAALVQVL